MPPTRWQLNIIILSSWLTLKLVQWRELKNKCILQEISSCNSTKTSKKCWGGVKPVASVKRYVHQLVWPKWTTRDSAYKLIKLNILEINWFFYYPNLIAIRFIELKESAWSIREEIWIVTSDSIKYSPCRGCHSQILQSTPPTLKYCTVKTTIYDVQNTIYNLPILILLLPPNLKSLIITLSGEIFDMIWKVFLAIIICS